MSCLSFRKIEASSTVRVVLAARDQIQDEQMLMNEISIHKATDHPNILRLLEIFEDVGATRIRALISAFEEKNLFLVTELCGAGDLGRLGSSPQARLHVAGY